MNINLFDLALEKTRASDWEHFEELSSRFLATEFDGLRTMASPSGDGGRDSELFNSNGRTAIAVQYSVTTNWDRKIKDTLSRLEENFDGVRVLIYMSNKKIGALADNIKKYSLDRGVSLDIRDASWFLDRLNVDDNKYEAAKHYADTIAVPLLENQKIIETKRPALTGVEQKAALVYLSMQWQDEETDKGLTKIVYESLVLAALRNTNAELRMPRSDIHKTIGEYLTSTCIDQTTGFIDTALTRLTKNKIRHETQEDEFSLTHAEVYRIKNRLIESGLDDCGFEDEIGRLITVEIDDEKNISEDDLGLIKERIIRVLDSFLVKSGELFAQSVASNEISVIDRELLSNVVFDDINNYPSSNAHITYFPDLALNVIARISSSSDPTVRSHLRRISDSYTLFAFLRETPDVQRATKKIFGHGVIWIDTSIILPLLVGAFDPEGNLDKYGLAISGLEDAGVKLRVTEGVIMELLNHIRLAVACSNRPAVEWQGRIPFLYQNYIRLGYAPINFSSSVERFRGFERPIDDMGDYLLAKFGIKVESLSKDMLKVDEELRYSVERLWTEAHGMRRQDDSNSSSSSDSTEILIRNDVESYLGVLGRRTKEASSELGYKNWWLTIDSVAWKIRTKLREESISAPSSPLMSLDYLLGTLTFGPARSNIDRSHEQMLPVLLDIDFSDNLPRRLLDIASSIRQENEGIEEYLVERKIRDACDRLKGKYGHLTRLAGNAEQEH